MQESNLIKVTGDVRDTIKYPDGRVEVVESHNLVVDGVFNLITSLLANKGGYTGISYWAVGQGASSWDTSTPNPTVSETKLVAEVGRKQINSSDVTWVNESDEVSSTPTNKLRVRCTFGPNECTGSWREFAIFGGNATATKDSGIMINHKNHPIMTKSEQVEIEREIIFTFSRQ